MIEVILGSCLGISIIASIILSSRKTPVDGLLSRINELSDENSKLKLEIESIQRRLDTSNQRRKNLLSINKGERALIPNYSLTQGRGTKSEKSFEAFYECDVIEVTDKKIKVVPYSVVTDCNEINSDQSALQSVMDFLKNKWVDISQAQPILDTQVRREDKLEELTEILENVQS